jgi:hypothetical protein
MMSEPLPRWIQEREKLNERARRRTIPVIVLVIFFILLGLGFCILTLLAVGYPDEHEMSRIPVDNSEYVVTCENLWDGPVELTLYRCEIGQKYENCGQVFVDWGEPPCPTEMELQIEENTIQIYGYSYYDGRKHLMSTYEMQSSD